MTEAAVVAVAEIVTATEEAEVEAAPVLFVLRLGCGVGSAGVMTTPLMDVGVGAEEFDPAVITIVIGCPKLTLNLESLLQVQEEVQTQKVAASPVHRQQKDIQKPCLLDFYFFI
jgi:hypothetical protein